MQLVAFRGHVRLITLAAAAVAAAACGCGQAAPGPPIQVEVAASVAGEGRALTLSLDIRTEPGLLLRVACQGSPCPSEATATADAAGHATITVSSPYVSETNRFTVYASDSGNTRVQGQGFVTLADATNSTPRLERDITGNLRCANRGRCAVNLAMPRTVIATALPPGSVLVAGDQQAVVDATGRAAVTLAKSLCDDARVDVIMNALPERLPPVTVRVRTPTGHVTSGEIAASPSGCRDELVGPLERVVTRPIEPDGPEGTGLVFFGRPESYALGAPARPSDVRFVAIETLHERNTTCGPYRNTRTGEVVSFGRQVAGSEITVYLRKPGAVRASRSFPGSRRCPQTVDGATQLSTAANQASVRRWLASLVPSGAPVRQVEGPPVHEAPALLDAL